MATTFFTFTPDISVNANAQALYGAIHTFMLANGWTQTGDTGQTDPTSMTAQASNNTYTAYTVYTPNDALTAYYVKIAWGRGNSSTCPAVQITVGRSTNGAGTLSNVAFSAQAAGVETGIGSTANSGKCYVSSAAGRLFFAFGLIDGTNVSNGVVSLHRSVDASGAMTSTAMEMFAQKSSVNYYHVLPASGTIPTLQTAVSYFMANGLQTADWTVGGSVYFAAMFNPLDGSVLNPSPMMLVSGSSNVTNASSTTVTVYASHTYLGLTHVQGQFGNTVNARGLFLYE